MKKMLTMVAQMIKQTVCFVLVALSVMVCWGRVPTPPEYGMEGAEKELVLAVSKGDVDTVKKLISEGVNVNATNGMGRTILSNATLFENTENNAKIIKLLITAGIDVNAKQPGGFPAIITATLKGNIETTKLLLAAGADVDVQLPGGSRALMLVREAEIAKALIGAGADINVKNNSEETALDIAEKNKNTEIIELLKTAKRNQQKRETQ